MWEVVLWGLGLTGGGVGIRLLWRRAVGGARAVIRADEVAHVVLALPEKLAAIEQQLAPVSNGFAAEVLQRLEAIECQQYVHGETLLAHVQEGRTHQ